MKEKLQHTAPIQKSLWLFLQTKHLDKKWHNTYSFFLENEHTFHAQWLCLDWVVNVNDEMGD